MDMCVKQSAGKLFTRALAASRFPQQLAAIQRTIYVTRRTKADGSNVELKDQRRDRSSKGEHQQSVTHVGVVYVRNVCHHHIPHNRPLYFAYVPSAARK